MHPDQLSIAIRAVFLSFPAGKLISDIRVKVNILVIFPSSCSQFFVLSSTQTHEPSEAEFKIGGKRR
jgi:hypothetical protein